MGSEHTKLVKLQNARKALTGRTHTMSSAAQMDQGYVPITPISSFSDSSSYREFDESAYTICGTLTPHGS
jgi:hypothetical protein